MKRLLSICLIVLMASTPRSSGSTVELTDGEDDEMHISVVSNNPETTYSGKLGFKVSTWGHRSTLTQQYKSGEEFCIYTPVLGMRDFSCYIMLTKYWDVDIEMTLRDSEGEVITRGSVEVTGRRTPHGILRYDSIPRPDIVSVCLRNLGTTKTVFHSIYLASKQNIEKYHGSLLNMTAEYNVTSDTLGRVEGHLNEMAVMSKADASSIMQDYFRQLAIASWVDRRCIINSLLMLFCCGGSTALIRRWFGAPRSTV